MIKISTDIYPKYKISKGVITCKEYDDLIFSYLNYISTGYGIPRYFYNNTKITGSVSFQVLTHVYSPGLTSTFYNCTGITGVSFPNLTVIGNESMYEGFYNCTGITGTVAFPKVTSIGNSAMYECFYNCTGITSVSFNALTSIGSQGLMYAFRGCTNITSASFPNLTSIGSSGFNSALSNTNITTISFPKLTTVGNMGLSNAFNGCSRLTEIHFRADAQSVISGTSGYNNNFRAPSATIYFDL